MQQKHEHGLSSTHGISPYPIQRLFHEKQRSSARFIYVFDHASPLVRLVSQYSRLLACCLIIGVRQNSVSGFSLVPEGSNLPACAEILSHTSMHGFQEVAAKFMA
jgi:hypothetical protein